MNTEQCRTTSEVEQKSPCLFLFELRLKRMSVFSWLKGGTDENDIWLNTLRIFRID